MLTSWVRCGKLKCNLYKWKTLKGQGNNLCTYNICHMNNTFDKNIWVFLSLQWWKPHLLKYFGNQLLGKKSKHEYGSYIWWSLLIPPDTTVTCSRVEKIFFWNVWSSSSTNWGHKNHTKEPNKKLYQVSLSKIVWTDKQWYEENINFLYTCNFINKKINIFL